MHRCLCGGDVEINNVSLSSGMDGGYNNWEICCKKCGGSWQWAADGFYGRNYYSKDEVIDMWNNEMCSKKIDSLFNASGNWRTINRVSKSI